MEIPQWSDVSPETINSTPSILKTNFPQPYIWFSSSTSSTFLITTSLFIPKDFTFVVFFYPTFSLFSHFLIHQQQHTPYIFYKPTPDCSIYFSPPSPATIPSTTDLNSPQNTRTFLFASSAFLNFEFWIFLILLI